MCKFIDIEVNFYYNALKILKDFIDYLRCSFDGRHFLHIFVLAIRMIIIITLLLYV